MLKTLKNDVHGPLKIAGDGAIPKGSILFQYRPQCVLIVTKCWLSGSNESFWWAQSTGLASIGSTSGFFSNLAVIPLVTPRPGLKTLGWHWIVLVNCICTSCGKPAPETRILHIGFQSSLTRESQFQFLPKRGGCEPLTTRSGTMPLWVCDFGTWIGQGTNQKLGHSALFWFIGGYWKVKVEFPWNACCKSPGI